MKKIIFGAFLLTTISTVSAQVRISPGVRGGLSTSEINDVRGSNRTNFYLGTFIDFRFAKWYALQPELNYARQGMTADYGLVDFDPIATTQKVDWKLDYLGLTLSNKFFVYRGLNLQVSPFVDVLINKKNVDPRNEFDLGINLGIGYDFPNGLGIEARLKSGGVDLFDDYVDEDYDDRDYLFVNSAFQIGVTYTFDMRKAK